MPVEELKLWMGSLLQVGKKEVDTKCRSKYETLEYPKEVSQPVCCGCCDCPLLLVYTDGVV